MMSALRTKAAGVETERRVLVAGADDERQRDDGDEQERRDDAPRSRALLALFAYRPAAPEHEHASRASRNGSHFASASQGTPQRIGDSP